jgi:hypothetical protein
VQKKTQSKRELDSTLRRKKNSESLSQKIRESFISSSSLMFQQKRVLLLENTRDLLMELLKNSIKLRKITLKVILPDLRPMS